MHIEHPMEATVLLIVPKAGGDMSVEEKEDILAMFEREFELPKREAGERGETALIDAAAA